MLPKKDIGKVIEKRILAGNVWLVRLEFAEIQNYLPGQYASLKVSDSGERRSYSVASLPGEKQIDLIVDVSPMGVGSKFVLGLQVGNEVEVMTYLGRFVLDEQALENNRPMIFVGTGTGIAPLKPMIETVLNRKGYTNAVSLVWGMRHETDLYWVEQLEGLKARYANFNFEVVLSQSGETWQGHKGHVGEVIDTLGLEWAKVDGYLCGNKNMIIEMSVKLAKLGVNEMHIHYEKFF